MLPVQSWRTDAVVRLLVSIFVCLYAAAMVSAAAHHLSAGKLDPRLLAVAALGIAALAAALVLIHKPLTSPRPGRQFGITMICFYVGMMLGVYAQQLAGKTPPSVLQMVISALGLQGSSVILVLLFTRQHLARPSEAFGLRQWPGRAIAWGVLVAAAFFPLAWVIQDGWVHLLRLLPGVDPREQEAVQILRLADSLPERAVLAIITVGLAPVAEELLFRGVLYPWIRQLGFPRLALWVTCLLFGAVHFNLASFLALACFAVCLTGLYHWRGNLLACIAAHASFNALNFSLLYLTR